MIAHTENVKKIIVLLGRRENLTTSVARVSDRRSQCEDVVPLRRSGVRFSLALARKL